MSHGKCFCRRSKFCQKMVKKIGDLLAAVEVVDAREHAELDNFERMEWVPIKS